MSYFIVTKIGHRFYICLPETNPHWELHICLNSHHYNQKTKTWGIVFNISATLQPNQRRVSARLECKVGEDPCYSWVYIRLHPAHTLKRTHDSESYLPKARGEGLYMRAPEQLQLCVLRGIKENSEYPNGRAQTGAIQKSDPNIGMAVHIYSKAQVTALTGKKSKQGVQAYWKRIREQSQWHLMRKVHERKEWLHLHLCRKLCWT